MRSTAAVSHHQVREMLSESSNWRGEVVTLGSTGNGSFERVDNLPARPAELVEPGENFRSRIAVFLGAGALSGGE